MRGRDISMGGDVDMTTERSSISKEDKDRTYIIPLALRKSFTTYHWNIEVNNRYPFQPPKVFNLNGIKHPDIDPNTGFLMIDYLNK